jgi:hypothetical protein
MVELDRAEATSADGRVSPLGLGALPRRRVCFGWAGRLEDRTLLSVVPALVSESPTETPTSTVIEVPEAGGSAIDTATTASVAEGSTEVAIAISSASTSGGLVAAEVGSQVLPPPADATNVSVGVTAPSGLDTSVTPASSGSGSAQDEGGAADSGSTLTGGSSEVVWEDSADVIDGLLTGRSAATAEPTLDEGTGDMAAGDVAIADVGVVGSSSDVAQRGDGIARFSAGATMVAGGHSAISSPVIRSAARNVALAVQQVIERAERAASVVELGLAGLATAGGQAAVKAVDGAQGLIANGLKVVSAKLMLVGPTPVLDPGNVMDALDDGDPQDDRAAEAGTVTVMRIAEAVAVAAVVYVGREAARRDGRVRRSVGRLFARAWGLVVRGRDAVGV